MYLRMGFLSYIPLSAAKISAVGPLCLARTWAICLNTVNSVLASLSRVTDSSKLLGLMRPLKRRVSFDSAGDLATAACAVSLPWESDPLLSLGGYRASSWISTGCVCFCLAGITPRVI